MPEKIKDFLSSSLTLFALTFLGSYSKLKEIAIPEILGIFLNVAVDPQMTMTLIGLSIGFACLSLSKFTYANDKKERDFYWAISSKCIAIFFGGFIAWTLHGINLANPEQVLFAIIAGAYFVLCFSVRETLRQLWIANLQHQNCAPLLAKSLATTFFIVTTASYFQSPSLT